MCQRQQLVSSLFLLLVLSSQLWGGFGYKTQAEISDQQGSQGTMRSLDVLLEERRARRLIKEQRRIEEQSSLFQKLSSQSDGIKGWQSEMKYLQRYFAETKPIVQRYLDVVKRVLERKLELSGNPLLSEKFFPEQSSVGGRTPSSVWKRGNVPDSYEKLWRAYGDSDAIDPVFPDCKLLDDFPSARVPHDLKKNHCDYFKDLRIRDHYRKQQNYFQLTSPIVELWLKYDPKKPVRPKLLESTMPNAEKSSCLMRSVGRALALWTKESLDANAADLHKLARIQHVELFVKEVTNLLDSAGSPAADDEDGSADAGECPKRASPDEQREPAPYPPGFEPYTRDYLLRVLELMRRSQGLPDKAESGTPIKWKMVRREPLDRTPRSPAARSGTSGSPPSSPHVWAPRSPAARSGKRSQGHTGQYADLLNKLENDKLDTLTERRSLQRLHSSRKVALTKDLQKRLYHYQK